MPPDTFTARLELTIDTPNGMDYTDTYEGLDNPWYKFEATPENGVTLYANPDGYEHLARVFLKMARTNKALGYHAHHAMELGQSSYGPPEFTIALSNEPT